MQVSAFKRVKSRLGVGQEDRFSYGQSVGPNGVLSVDVPNYQLRAQRQQTMQPQMTLQPLPKLPTPFAAAQVPLPDDSDGARRMSLSRAGSNLLAEHAKTLAAAPLMRHSAQRGPLPLRRQSLVPGQASVAPKQSRLGSAPPSIRRLSAPGLTPGPSLLPRHNSAPGLGQPCCPITLLLSC